jgi:membrane-bound inhibitor of C-type lysozyme
LEIPKKGQAAMEFLMTYGWAILIVLVVIGALVSFDILSPDLLLPNKCTLPSGISCVDHKVSSTGISIVLRNSLGYDMSSITVSTENCGTTSTPSTIPNGEKATYTISCSPSGTKYRGQLNVTYTLSDTGLSHTARGSIISRIE